MKEFWKLLLVYAINFIDSFLNTQMEKFLPFKPTNYWKGKIKRKLKTTIKKTLEILFPKIQKMILMVRDLIIKEIKGNKKNRKKLKKKQNQRNKFKDKINLCFRNVNSMKFLNSQLLLSMISFRNIWYFWKVRKYWQTLTSLTTLCFSTFNKYQNCWRESGYFIRQRLWSFLKKYCAYLHNW